ncbi:hypothetical protein HDV05_000496 [Chytridiales sp. JEL 0842]|nr:hypothetical protein HDV05_000496 [Chytridiales sp. JEL 0842]
MVVFTVKRNDDVVFLFQTHVSASTTSVIADVVKLYNLKLRLKRLVEATSDILEYGPTKQIEEQGYSVEEIESFAKNENHESPLKGTIVERGSLKYVLNPDPTGRRTGEAPMPEIAETIKKTLDSAQVLLSKEFNTGSNFLTTEHIEEAIRNISGALTIAYPMGLPEWEPVKDILNDTEDLSGTQASKEVIPEKEAALWWAGKEILADKVLSDFVGKNDKTKIIVKLQKKSQGAPVREAPLDEKAQRELMAYYYKKQEEHKKLVENDEDDYLNSSWANSKSLKAAFNGVGNVSWRPTRM